MDVVVLALVFGAVLLLSQFLCAKQATMTMARAVEAARAVSDGERDERAQMRLQILELVQVRSQAQWRAPQRASMNGTAPDRTVNGRLQAHQEALDRAAELNEVLAGGDPLSMAMGDDDDEIPNL